MSGTVIDLDTLLIMPTSYMVLEAWCGDIYHPDPAALITF